MTYNWEWQKTGYDREWGMTDIGEWATMGMTANGNDRECWMTQWGMVDNKEWQKMVYDRQWWMIDNDE